MSAHTLEDLIQMSSGQLHAIMQQGHALDPEALAGRQYLGVDLSMPAFMSKLLWKTFRKTFHRDSGSDHVRGWNVRMQQTGVRGPARPMTDRVGQPITFGHYHLESGQGVAFPHNFRCPNFLNYGAGKNSFVDLARLGYTPLVAVNPGSQELLLGWEVIKLGPKLLPLPLYWALEFSGPLDCVVAPPQGLH